MIRFYLSICVFSFVACSNDRLQNESADTCVLCGDVVFQPPKDSVESGGEIPEDARRFVSEVVRSPGIADAASFALDSGQGTAEVASEQADDASNSDSEEDAKAETSPIIVGEGYYGSLPPYWAPIEAFDEVYDQAGDPVGVEDLTGSWTVLWFFPKASTFG